MLFPIELPHRDGYENKINSILVIEDGTGPQVTTPKGGKPGWLSLGWGNLNKMLIYDWLVSTGLLFGKIRIEQKYHAVAACQSPLPGWEVA